VKARAVASKLIPKGKLKTFLGDQRGRGRLVVELFPRGSVGAEIGVWKGDFSRLILRRVRPTELHLIDPWAHADEEYSASLYGRASQDEMDAIYGSVVASFGGDPGVLIHREMSLAAVQRFDDAHFDWVYIDGDHTYEGARADLMAWTSKVKAGGVVMCDDYGDGGWWEGAVKRAVDDYTAEKSLPLHIEASQAWFKVQPG
jgi:Methyltransferase domain